MSELIVRVTEILDRLAETPADVATVVPPELETAEFDLTIGIATYDDFDGAWFTINSLRLHHRALMERTEILLLDNHPEGRESSYLKGLENASGSLRYIPITSVRSTAIRDLIFRHARGRVVMVLDSHILLESGALDAVLAYFDARPGTRDLVQGPMLSTDGSHVAATHWEESWNKGMFGQWAKDQRGEDINGEPFDIPMQGLAAFACLRENWPGLNPRFSGFGGEEGYLHEKVRQRGGRTVCIPAFRWVHRFDRPRGVPYSIKWADRIRNYAVGWSELGKDVEPMFEHFREYLGAGAEPSIDWARRELASRALLLDGLIVVNDDLRPGAWRVASELLAAHGQRARRIGRNDSASTEISVLLTLAEAVRYARNHGWVSVGILGDRMSAESGPLSEILAGDVSSQDGVRWLGSRPSADPEWLRDFGVLVQGHELAAFAASLPATAEDAEAWLRDHALDELFTQDGEAA